MTTIDPHATRRAHAFFSYQTAELKHWDLQQLPHGGWRAVRKPVLDEAALTVEHVTSTHPYYTADFQTRELAELHASVCSTEVAFKRWEQRGKSHDAR